MALPRALPLTRPQDVPEPLTVLSAKVLAAHLLALHESGRKGWQRLPSPLLDLLLRCLAQRRKFTRPELSLFVPLQGVPVGGASIAAKLETIDFGGRSGAQAWLYDADVAYIVRACPALRHLSLQNCLRLSTPAVVSTSLLHLDVSRCSSQLNPRLACPALLFLALDMKKRILKKQLQALSVACPRLTHLRLARLPADELFLTFPAPHLRVLDLSLNPSLRLTGLSALAALYPALRTVVVVGSPALADQFRRMRVAQALPGLQLIADDEPAP